MNDLLILGSEKLKLCGNVEWSLRLSVREVREGVESLEGRTPRT